MSKKYSILYVDDEVSNLTVFKNTFRRDYNIFTAETAKEGLQILDKEKIDLILTDQRMPEMSGVEFLKKVMVSYPQPSRILITAYTDFDALKDAVNEAKIFQYIQKPWDEKEIQQIISNALEIYQLRQKNIELTEKLNIQNKELIRLNKELVELDKLKFQFLSIISHEIRTPLNGLVGAITILKSELTESEFLKYNSFLNILDSSALRLNHFLLLAQRITEFKASSYQISPAQLDIRILVDKVVNILHEKIKAKDISVEYQFSEERNYKCYADEYLFKICLKEVLDNAVKYSDKSGKIIIKTSFRGDRIVIDIIDNGPGFPEIVLKNLFKFSVTDEDITKQGMGLDLGMVQLIMKAHNGIIDIKNNESAGATVSLIL
jgi:signal transduction histidine kinase